MWIVKDLFFPTFKVSIKEKVVVSCGIDHNFNWFMTCFDLLQIISNTKTVIRNILSNKSCQACRLSQRDVTELHAADNALTCLS